MIVVVGHGGIEHHAPEQFGAIGFGLVGPATQIIGQQRIGPAFTLQIAVVAVE